jgi:hypothetical protein
LTAYGRFKLRVAVSRAGAFIGRLFGGAAQPFSRSTAEHDYSQPRPTIGLFAVFPDAAQDFLSTFLETKEGAGVPYGYAYKGRLRMRSR